MNRAFRCNRLPVEQKFKCERNAVCDGLFIINATRAALGARDSLLCDDTTRTCLRI